MKILRGSGLGRKSRNSRNFMIRWAVLSVGLHRRAGWPVRESPVRRDGISETGMAFQPVPEARLPEAGGGRAIPAAPDKLQRSLKSPANLALQSCQPWDTNSPIDRNPMKGDAPTNSCSEPKKLTC